MRRGSDGAKLSRKFILPFLLRWIQRFAFRERRRRLSEIPEHLMERARKARAELKQVQATLGETGEEEKIPAHLLERSKQAKREASSVQKLLDEQDQKIKKTFSTSKQLEETLPEPPKDLSIGESLGFLFKMIGMGCLGFLFSFISIWTAYRWGQGATEGVYAMAIIFFSWLFKFALVRRIQIETLEIQGRLLK